MINRQDIDLNAKQLNISMDTRFPFYYSETHGVHKDSTILHWHEEIEICYVKQGSGEYLIDGKIIKFSPEDIIIINGRQFHLAYNDKNLIFGVYIFHPSILWSPLANADEINYISPYWYVSMNKSHLISKISKNSEEIICLLSKIEKEYINQDKNYKLIIKAYLLQISVELFRILEIEDHHSAANRINQYDKLKVVLDFIETNFSQNLNLVTLSSLLNMSVSNFSLIFKKTMDMSPIEYVNKVRIYNASRLLLNTDEKIIDIALKCGFPSMPNFINQFRKYTQKTPKEYRLLENT